MRGVGLRGEIARVGLAFEADGEFLERDVGAELRQKPHALGIVYFDIAQRGLRATVEEDARRGTGISAQGYHRALGQTLVAPVGRKICAVGLRLHAVEVDAEVGGAVNHVVRLGIESNSCAVIELPAFAFGKELSAVHAAVCPRRGAERDAALGAVGHYLHLRDVGLGEVDGKVAQHCVLAVYQRERQHTAVAYERGTAAVEREVFPFRKVNRHVLGVVLVVVGYIIGAHGCALRVEVVRAFFEAERHAVAGLHLRLDVGQGFLHLRREIFCSGRHAVVRHAKRAFPCLRGGEKYGE